MAMPEGEAGEPESGRGAQDAGGTLDHGRGRPHHVFDSTGPSGPQGPSDHASSRAVGRRAGRAPRGEQAGRGSALPPTGDYGDAVRRESLVGAARLPVELGKPGRGIPGCALASATGSTATCRPLFPWSAVRINPAGPGPGRAATSRGRPGTRPLRRGSATPSPSPPPGARSLARRPRPRARNQSPK